MDITVIMGFMDSSVSLVSKLLRYQLSQYNRSCHCKTYTHMLEPPPINVHDKFKLIVTIHRCKKEGCSGQVPSVFYYHPIGM